MANIPFSGMSAQDLMQFYEASYANGRTVVATMSPEFLAKAEKHASEMMDRAFSKGPSDYEQHVLSMALVQRIKCEEGSMYAVLPGVGVFEMGEAFDPDDLCADGKVPAKKHVLIAARGYPDVGIYVEHALGAKLTYQNAQDSYERGASATSDAAAAAVQKMRHAHDMQILQQLHNQRKIDELMGMSQADMQKLTGWQHTPIRVGVDPGVAPVPPVKRGFFDRFK